EIKEWIADALYDRDGERMAMYESREMSEEKTEGDNQLSKVRQKLFFDLKIFLQVEHLKQKKQKFQLQQQTLMAKNTHDHGQVEADLNQVINELSKIQVEIFKLKQGRPKNLG